MEIVATSRAAQRGFCQHAGCRIERGGRIFKIDVGARGHQTAGRNGKGEWWCENCAAELDRQLSLHV
jgi:hypothetical protein